MKQITMTADIKTMALTDKLRLAKERIAELEQELSDSQGIVQLLTMRQTEAAGSYDALKKANASLKEQFDDALRTISSMAKHESILKEQLARTEAKLLGIRQDRRRLKKYLATAEKWEQTYKRQWNTVMDNNEDLRQEINRLRDQLRVRGERMEKMLMFIRELDSFGLPVSFKEEEHERYFNYQFYKSKYWFDENGKVLDE